MDDDYRELAIRLFAAMAAMLEDATKAAAAEQSLQADPACLTARACRIQAATRDIAVLSGAVLIVVSPETGQHRSGLKSRL